MLFVSYETPIRNILSRYLRGAFQKVLHLLCAFIWTGRRVDVFQM